jgi:hypothetical protein
MPFERRVGEEAGTLLEAEMLEAFGRVELR